VEVIQMAVVNGRIFKVNDKLALVPILLGDIPPLFGYAAWPGLTVTATCYVEVGIFGELPVASFSATTAGDGSYSLSVDVPNPFQGQPVSVAITMSSGVPVYRSGRVPLDTASRGKLNFWILPVPNAGGITAGTISSKLADVGLPSGTSLSTNPAGLDVSFSEAADLIDVWFGVAVRPDSSPNLQNFVDLSLRYLNIVDLLPPFISPTGADIIQEIENGVAGAAGDLNSTVLTMMEKQIEDQDKVSAATAQKFFTKDVSVTFTNIIFANYKWDISAISDGTTVMTATLCIGFPRIPTPGEPIL
jgi:hypothetical protein